jgi:hypothetical protein
MGTNMKNLVIATTIAAFTATTAFAGGNSDAAMEPEVMTEEVMPAGSAAGWIVPVMALVLIALVASGSSDEEEVMVVEGP